MLLRCGIAMIFLGAMKGRISAAVWEQIKTAYASGLGLREIARNMNVPEGTVLAHAKRKGWTQQIQSAKRAAQSARSDDAITPMESVAVTMQQRAERHVVRIAGVTENVLPYLESMQPAAILDGIHEIEKYDRMARRNYGLRDDERQTGGALTLSVLTNQAAIQIIQEPN